MYLFMSLQDEVVSVSTDLSPPLHKNGMFPDYQLGIGVQKHRAYDAQVTKLAQYKNSNSDL